MRSSTAVYSAGITFRGNHSIGSAAAQKLCRGSNAWLAACKENLSHGWSMQGC